MIINQEVNTHGQLFHNTPHLWFDRIVIWYWMSRNLLYQNKLQLNSNSKQSRLWFIVKFSIHLSSSHLRRKIKESYVMFHDFEPNGFKFYDKTIRKLDIRWLWSANKMKRNYSMLAQPIVGFALYQFHIHKKNKSENEIKT